MKNELLLSFPSLVEGTLLKRYKRFLTDVALPNGDVVTAHCANTGPMKGVLYPGGRVRLRHNPSSSRKLDWTWEQAEALDHYFALRNYKQEKPDINQHYKNQF